jgi:hypothetical protein
MRLVGLHTTVRLVGILKAPVKSGRQSEAGLVSWLGWETWLALRSNEKGKAD